MEKTLGSLFDGIGGFPLAGSYSGFKTLWASEIEPFPIRVTQMQFPQMRHLGDITKINGAAIEPTAVITGGSPCQDLSVAGLRAGMAQKCSQCGMEFDIKEVRAYCPACGAEIKKTRSGLFMEQVRIVKEMRKADAERGRTGQFVRPRFMVWENVPGAFSSHGGEDFRIVLEETCRVADDSVHIPRSPARWPVVGAVMGNGFSVAWRVLDAQYWGVPQRRRRIFLVADFGGESAPEILFKRESMSGNSAQGGATGQKTAVGLEVSTPKAIAIDNNCQDSRFRLTGDICPTLPAKAGTGGNNGPMLAVSIHPKVSGTLTSKMAKGTGGPAGDECQNLVCIDKFSYNCGENARGAMNIMQTGITPTLTNDSHTPGVVSRCRGEFAVRRLTPLECERLQGFPDGWTDLPGASDSARYKALGNSVAVPCVAYIMRGIAEELKKRPPL